MVGVTLSKDTFKALSSDIRIDILRALDSRNMTLSELSRQLNIHKTTLYSHLTILKDVGLIKRNERKGHKWVYYKLTWSGTSILHPEQSRILVTVNILVFSLFSFFSLMLIGIMYLSPIVSQGEEGPSAEPYHIIIIDIWFIFLIIIFFILLITTISSIIQNRKVKKIHNDYIAN